MFMNIVLLLILVDDYVYAGCCWRGTCGDVYTRSIAMCDESLFFMRHAVGFGFLFRRRSFSFSDSVYCAHRFFLRHFFALRCVSLRYVAFCCVTLRFVAFCCVLLRFHRVLTCAWTYCEDLLIHRIWNYLKSIAKVGMCAPIPFNSDACHIYKQCA